MRRTFEVLLVVIAVGVFGLAGYVLKHSDPVPGAGTYPSESALPPVTSASDPPSTTPSPTPTSSTPTSSTPVTSSTPEPTHTSTRPTPTSSPSSTAPTQRVAFVGDNYAAGLRATSPAKAWPALATDQLKVTGQAFAVAGAGYAKAGTGGGAYASLVPAVVAFRPDVVVVTGGRNDRADDPATLTTDARQLFAALRTALPKATLVAVAPWWGDSPHPAALTMVDDAVKAGVTAANGTYLALADPLAGDANLMADAANPDDAGHAKLAATVANALRSKHIVR